MKHKKINSLELEQYILNEIPDYKKKEINLQLKKNPSLRKKIEKIKISNREILDQYPPDYIAPHIINSYETEKNKEEHITRSKPIILRRLLYASPALALTLVLFFIILPTHKSKMDLYKQFGFPNGTRIKGEQTIDMSRPNIVVYRKNNDIIELLKSGYKAKAGDLLQIAYIAAEETHGVILSIDGNGTVTLHYPGMINQSTALKNKKIVLLGNSYELDDAPGFERFFFITSKSEIDIEKVTKNAQNLAYDAILAKTVNIKMDGTYKQTSILILKGDKL